MHKFIATTLVIALVLSGTPVEAKKTSKCTTGGSDNPCHGAVLTKGTPATHKSCTAGSKGQNHPNCSGSN